VWRHIQPFCKARVISRDEYLLLAKVAEEAERYEGQFIQHRCIWSSPRVFFSLDLVAQIKCLTQTYGALTIEERNLLSVAYKNITNSLRSSWRVVDSLEKLESARPSAQSRHHVSLIRRQRARIEKELTDACKDIVKLLTDSLLATAKPGEETVFYYKL